MAAKNGNGLQGFVKNQLEEAQKRFSVLEGEAEKALNNLITRGKESRRELEDLIQRVNTGDLALTENAHIKKLGQRAEAAGSQMRKRLDQLQNRVVEATGVASQTQVKELQRELSRLARKIDALTGTKKTKAGPNA